MPRSWNHSLSRPSCVSFWIRVCRALTTCAPLSASTSYTVRKHARRLRLHHQHTVELEPGRPEKAGSAEHVGDVPGVIPVLKLCGGGRITATVDPLEQQKFFLPGCGAAPEATEGPARRKYNRSVTFSRSVVRPLDSILRVAISISMMVRSMLGLSDVIERYIGAVVSCINSRQLGKIQSLSAPRPPVAGNFEDVRNVDLVVPAVELRQARGIRAAGGDHHQPVGIDTCCRIEARRGITAVRRRTGQQAAAATLAAIQ